MPAQQPNVSDSDDAVLIAAIAAGDQRAFRTLFARHGERVFRYAWRLTRDEGKAEEVTNDVMLEVWRAAARFEGRSLATTWLLGITRNLAFNSMRRKQHDTVDLAAVAEPADESAKAESAASARDGARLREALRGALARLSPEHRDVVELTFFHDCAYPEIAEIVGCPVGTVKTRMFHAKKQLQRLLREMRIDLPFGDADVIERQQGAQS